MSLYNSLFENKDNSEWISKLREYDGAIKHCFNTIENTHLEYYPRKQDVFRSLSLTPLSQVKVVIWGQDPYPTLLSDGTPRAQGYSFGVRKDDVVPKSLINIYKEIKQNFPSFNIPNHGDLTYIAKQGVLFMNSSLTYAPENPKAHLNVWKRFIYILIQILNKNVENCIHIIWGKNAEKLLEHINSRECYISSHPSPMSCRGFFGCRHFLKINITLKRQNKKQINWNENDEDTPTFIENLKI